MQPTRFLEVAQHPAKLSLRNGCIVLTREADSQSRFAQEGAPTVEITIPVGELSCVVLAHPQVYLTQPAMAALMEAGCPLVVCDANHMPAGMMLPLKANTLQTQRMLAQAATPRPVRKRLWQQIVRWKVRAQARVLASVHGDDGGLFALAETVRSGDPANVEAQAAARYWPLLFHDPLFRRRFDAPDQNRLLNYGYAVLRAAVARAICAAGLHPTLGLHHHHRENPYCLADDLMEPYRPLIDAEVREIVAGWGADSPLTPENKKRLIEVMDLRLDEAGPGSPLRPVTAHVAGTAFSVAQAFAQGDAAVKVFYPRGLVTP